MIAAQSGAAKAHARKNRKRIRGIFKVTTGIFTALESYLSDNTTDSDGFYMKLRGASHVSESEMGEIRYDVLMYKGYAVVDWGDLSAIDDMLGMYQHRAVLTVPGALGIAVDVNRDVITGGYGLTIDEWVKNPYKGQIFMSAYLRMAATVLAPEYVVSASHFEPWS